MQKAITKSILLQQIRNAFDDVPFPFNCGLHTAKAMDDWIEDVETLRQITLDNDYIGSWWDVPIEDLINHMSLATSYLNEDGMVFYLPAFMTAVINHPELFSGTSWLLAHSFIPCMDDEYLITQENGEKIHHFELQFKHIHGDRKIACRDFLQYFKQNHLYDEWARDYATEASSHSFWK